MALGAMAKYPGLDVKIVPCGKLGGRQCAMISAHGPAPLQKTN
jgi:hypothetical protein